MMPTDESVPRHREFVVDTQVAYHAIGPRRMISALVGSLLFTFAALWLLRYDSEPRARIAAIASLVFFAGAPILALLVALLRPALGIVSRLRVDANAITWIAGSRTLAPFGLDVRRVSVPWSNVESLRVVDSQSIPLFAASKATFRFEFVGVVVRDFEAAIAPLPKIRTLLTRKLFEQSGVMAAGPVEGLSATELRAVLEDYRSHVI